MPRYIIKNRTKVTAATILAVVVLLLLVPSFSASVRQFSQKTIALPLRLFSGTVQYFRSKNDLAEENRRLRRNMEELLLEGAQFRELRSENKRLRGLLGFKEHAGIDTVSAEVIARNPNNWIDSFIIDKGTVSGVKKGAAVCSARGLLGKVVDAERDTSSVILLTHPAFKAGGMLRDTRISGIVVGTGGGLAKMVYLPVDAEVKNGTIVITSPFSRTFPKGITIGEVIASGKSRTGLYKYAVIRPFANPFDQEEVLCIR